MGSVPRHIEGQPFLLCMAYHFGCVTTGLGPGIEPEFRRLVNFTIDTAMNVSQTIVGCKVLFVRNLQYGAETARSAASKIA